jgi:saccharopine dehydrogenase-like NADP-dependent oxidoreductase
MKVVQLGCGITGLVCAEHVARNPNVTEMVLADARTDGAESLAARLRMDKVSVEKVDASDSRKVKRLLKDADVVVNSVPWEFMDEVQKIAAATGTDYVDFCLTVAALKNFEPVAKMCKDAGITAITATGLEPGISNALARYAANKLDSAEELHVIDGDNGVFDGYWFASTWSPYDWMEETTIPAAVFHNGKIEYIPPLHEKEIYDFPPPLGPLPVYKTVHDETFLLPKNIKGIRNADFRIGIDDNFAAAAKMIRKLGLHSKEPIDVKGVKVRPLDVVAAMMPRPVDIADKIKGCGGTVVEVIGKKNGKKTKVRVWTFVSHEWAYENFRSNGTGYLVGTGGAIPTEMLIDGEVKEKGLITPEQLPSASFIRRLGEKNLKVNEEITQL